jgi:hypothetical protein
MPQTVAEVPRTPLYDAQGPNVPAEPTQMFAPDSVAAVIADTYRQAKREGASDEEAKRQAAEAGYKFSRRKARRVVV